MTSTFLSIDWDFFPALQDDGGRTELPVGGSAPNALLYDWGLGEGPTLNVIQDSLWYGRAGHFRSLGLDIEEEFGIRPDLGSVRPEDFMAEMDRLAGGSVECPVSWADSHVHAFAAVERAFHEAGEPLTVLHFDAHHDLGYKERQIRAITKGRVDCGSWLLAALAGPAVKRVHVIYPDWRGLSEWEDSADCFWRPRPEYADAQTWTAYLELRGQETTNVVGAFVARSGGWTPPYLDEEYSDFVEVLAAPGQPVQLPPGEHHEMIRPWDEATIDEEAALRISMAVDRVRRAEAKA